MRLNNFMKQLQTRRSTSTILCRVIVRSDCDITWKIGKHGHEWCHFWRKCNISLFSWYNGWFYLSSLWVFTTREKSCAIIKI